MPDTRGQVLLTEDEHLPKPTNENCVDYHHELIMYHDACWRLFKATERRSPDSRSVDTAKDAVATARASLLAVMPESEPPCRGK